MGSERHRSVVLFPARRVVDWLRWRRCGGGRARACCWVHRRCVGCESSTPPGVEMEEIRGAHRERIGAAPERSGGARAALERGPRSGPRRSTAHEPMDEPMDGPVAAPVRRAQRPRQRAEVRDEVGDRVPAHHRDRYLDFFRLAGGQAVTSDAARVPATGTVEAGAAQADGKVNAAGRGRKKSSCGNAVRRSRRRRPGTDPPPGPRRSADRFAGQAGEAAASGTRSGRRW